MAVELVKLVFGNEAKTNESLGYQVYHRLQAPEQQLKCEIIPFGRLMAKGELIEIQSIKMIRTSHLNRNSISKK